MATPTEEERQEDARREKVVSLFSSTSTSFPLIVDGAAAVNCTRYVSMGLAVTDAAAATAFYGALGFAPVPDSASSPSAVPVLRSALGFEIHLLPATERVPEGKNILMDFPELKPPGHTHASWSVPSVPAVRALMDRLGVPISGTRSTLAIFVRDPDRTTLEFERNDGLDEPPAEGPSAAMIGRGRTLDHVGIRVRAPYDRHLQWYARMLGFNRLVNHYEANPEPLKNNPPWITRTETGVDINFIINCNTPAPAAGEATDAPLVTAEGALRPGIIYPAFEIAEDAETALARLRAAGAGANAVMDSEAHLLGLPRCAVRLLATGPSLFVRDLNGNFVRLVPAARP